MSRDIFHQARLLRAPSSLALSPAREGAATASLGNLGQGLSSSVPLIPFYNFLRALRRALRSLSSREASLGVPAWASLSGQLDREGHDGSLCWGCHCKMPNTMPSVQRWAVPGHSVPQFPLCKTQMLTHSPSTYLLKEKGQGLTPYSPLTSSHALSLQCFVFWGLFRGLNFMPGSWKWFESHGRAVGVWTTPSTPNLFQVAPPYSHPARCTENLLHLNDILHNLLCFISAPIDTGRPQHSISEGVPKGWQPLHPPWLSHLLLLLRLLQNPTGFWLGFKQIPSRLDLFLFLLPIFCSLETGLCTPQTWHALKKINTSLPAPQESFLHWVQHGALARRGNTRPITLYHRQSSCLHQVLSAVNFQKRGKIRKWSERRRHGVHKARGSGESTVVVVAVLNEQ